MELLIHSMGEFESLITPVLDLVKPRKLVEVGSEHGGLTTILNSWTLSNDAHLLSVDPAPSEKFKHWAQNAQCFTHIAKPSLEAFPELQDIDCWFVDGDHNWYTVYHELQNIHQHGLTYQKPVLAFLHDVAWPCGRRDSYYAPERIPAEYRQPHSYDIGVTLDRGAIVAGGFRGLGAFAWAIDEGGPRNGVLTAIEDFVAPHGEKYSLALVPGVFGIGVLFTSDAPWADALTRFLLPYHQNSLLAKLEENRLRNYLKVIDFFDQANARAV
ncbi:class I SAM-dependent methyltransferase [Noviherbaspirillum malthae]|uniref:class I SAM-dependent methyltransferase n=1 Tax=Noviherbaspirillum malthae TaxID=1260987 RepID=UPI00188F329E|nr:class I SAM-dependent methyltransferase [Noviherbaspirillum malthae]